MYDYLNSDTNYSKYMGSNMRADRVDNIFYLPSKTKILTDKFKFRGTQIHE